MGRETNAKRHSREPPSARFLSRSGPESRERAGAIGHAARSRLLAEIQGASFDDPNYWFLLFSVADQLKEWTCGEGGLAGVRTAPQQPVAVTIMPPSHHHRQNPQEVIN